MTHDDEDSARLDERLSRLPREVAPARELWPSIQARLRVPKTGAAAPAASRWASWQLFAVAASVAVVAVLAASLYYRGGQQVPPDAPPRAALASSFGPGYPLGSAYHAARAGLTDDLDRRLDALAPAARATVLENLETIRHAVDEINTALGADPANVLLQHQLLAAYQDELSVLANLQRVTERLPMRNEI